MADPDSHAQLLRRYVQDNDERAFAAVVERFKGLVFSTAFRRLGSRQLAEEATQTVFAIVARKARSLQRVGNLAAWLHRTATYVSRGIARTEARHRRKMNALIEDSGTGPPNGEDADEWCAIHPHLDEALESLPERDREVLLLRFYEDLSFREIGQRLGKSESAAQRQGHRAVEKLAQQLRRHGAARASVALVTAGLATQLASPAPAALATASLAKSALATAPTLSGTTLVANTVHTMSQTKTITIAAAAVAIAIVPLGVQRAAIAKEKRHIAALELKLKRSGAPHAISAPSTNRSALASGQLGNGIAGGNGRPIRIADWLDDFKAMSEAGDLSKIARATELLERLKAQPQSELERLLADARALDLPGDEHWFLLFTLHERIANFAPELALQSALLTFPDEGPTGRRLSIVARALAGYAKVHPEKAVDWYLASKSDGVIGGGKTALDEIHRGLLGKLLQTDDGQAQRLFDALNDRDQRIALENETERAHIRSTERQERLVELAASIGDIDQRRWALAAFARKTGKSLGLTEETLATAKGLAEAGSLPPEFSAHLIVAAATYQLGNPERSGAPLEQTLAWIEANSPAEFTERNLGAALGIHSREGNRKSALEIVRKAQAEGGASDATVSTFISLSRMPQINPTLALQLTAGLSTPEARAASAANIMGYWQRKPERIAAALETSGLSAADIATARRISESNR